MALNDAITGVVGDVVYVAMLPPVQTVRQRRTLGMLKRRIALAQRTRRPHQDGRAIREGLN